MTRKW